MNCFQINIGIVRTTCAVAVLLVVAFTACEPPPGPGGANVDGQGEQTCVSGSCIDLAGAEEIRVNYDRVDFEGLGGEAIVAQIATEIGATYIVHVDANVSFDFSMTDVSLFDPAYALLAASYVASHKAIEFQAESERYFLVILLGESNQEVAAKVRVVSDEVNLDPLNEMGAPMVINDLASPVTLVVGAYVYGYFPISTGHTYAILGRGDNGAMHVYAGVVPYPDRHVHDFEDPYGGSGIAFQAKRDGFAYLSVYAPDDNGVDGRIQVYSFDEALAPLSGQPQLVVNGGMLSASTVPGEIRRYYFLQQVGVDYSVLVTKESGTIHLFRSRVPSVDDKIHDAEDAYCDCTMQFRASYSGYTYLAIEDASNDTGSDFYVRVESP